MAPGDAWLESSRPRISEAAIAATDLSQLKIPGFNFHPLHGQPQRYSIHVNGPWAITFGWEDGYALDVDLEQYH